MSRSLPVRVLRRLVLEPYRALRGRQGARPHDPTARDYGLGLDLSILERARLADRLLEGVIEPAPPPSHLSVLLCGQPKSASLYAAQLVSLGLGLANHQIGFNRGSGDLYYPRLVAATLRPEPTISHSHALPTGLNLSLFRALGLRTLVLTRNLADSLISRLDMFLRDGYAGAMISSVGVARFLEAERPEQLDVIIDLFAPSYLNFQLGWEQQRGGPDGISPVFLTYEQVRTEPVETIRHVAEGLGLAFDRARAERAVSTIRSAGGINFNKGVPGRGREAFTGAQRERLLDLARRMGCEDLSSLGLGEVA